MLVEKFTNKSEGFTVVLSRFLSKQNSFHNGWNICHTDSEKYEGNLFCQDRAVQMLTLCSTGNSQKVVMWNDLRHAQYRQHCKSHWLLYVLPLVRTNLSLTVHLCVACACKLDGNYFLQSRAWRGCFMREIQSVYCQVELTNSTEQCLSLRRAKFTPCGIYSGQTDTGIGPPSLTPCRSTFAFPLQH